MTRANFADLLKAQRIKEQKQGEEKPKLEIVHPTPPTPATQPTLRTPPTPVSPEKDFTKVPNSIVREVLSKGMFIGKSKQIYDYLYLLTRGAIKPIRSVRITKGKLMKGSGVGSERTLLKNLSHLKTIGLIKVTEHEGQHLGNEYEIFLPEEVLPHPPHPPYPRQKVGTLPPVESGVGGVGQTIENKTIYSNAKTSFKDNIKNDDEPFGMMNDVLKRIGKGKAENWKELAELLEMEFEIAAARTKGVTNAPAFLTEHLRRRLIGKSEPSKPKANKLTQVGKQQPSEQVETYQPEPLTEQGRESTLKTFIGYIEKGQKDFLMSLQDTYTKEDWRWLTSKIGEANK
ncbi:MAG TPA: hypothetical protein VF596_22760 [Pyrinomonadaceae bacterium]|jgi:hypothetical protein